MVNLSILYLPTFLQSIRCTLSLRSPFIPTPNNRNPFHEHNQPLECQHAANHHWCHYKGHNRSIQCPTAQKENSTDCTWLCQKCHRTTQFKLLAQFARLEKLLFHPHCFSVAIALQSSSLTQATGTGGRMNTIKSWRQGEIILSLESVRNMTE